MKTTESLTHAGCGGNVYHDKDKNHYICDRCHAEAEGVVSASATGEEEGQEVLLCNPHHHSF